MDIALFWILFLGVSAWVLKVFYFSHDKGTVTYLRVAAIGIETAVWGLLFFPWLPESRGSTSGWGLIIQENDAGMTILASLLSVTLVSLFSLRKRIFFNVGVIAHITATAVLFGVMITLFPVTVTLRLRDTAPIVAALLLVINNAVLLLLWHQLQKETQQV